MGRAGRARESQGEPGRARNAANKDRIMSSFVLTNWTKLQNYNSVQPGKGCLGHTYCRDGFLFLVITSLTRCNETVPVVGLAV